jgi:hypothetical protein
MYAQQSPLTPAEITTLHTALHFMKMPELKAACAHLSLPDSGKKAELIHRIMTFVQTGAITQSPVIPAASRAKNYPAQPLHPNSLMLHGSYKNDLATRIFFKNLIGKHFHFTAYGIDWLTQRWHAGNPPTYQEFADYWSTEMVNRKLVKAKPKQEWALINFVQKRVENNPKISYEELMLAWKTEQRKQAQIAWEVIKKLL